MNTQYRKNLLDLAQASKTYTDKVAQEILWKVGEYDITTQDDNTTALVKTAPSGATRVKIKRVSGNCVKYAPSTASDDSVAKDKVIPENTYTTELNTLGGMSYKSENLCPTATYTGIMNNTIANSIDLGNLAQGTYTISLNITVNNDDRRLVFYFYNNGVLDTTTNIVTDVMGTGAKTYTFTLDSSYTYDDVRLGLNSGANNYSMTLDSLMLNKGSTALPYQPYFEGIRDSAVSAINVSGNVYPNEFISETKNGVVCTKNSDGTLTINGTTTGYPNFYGGSITLTAGSYYLPTQTNGNDVYYWIGTAINTNNIVNKQSNAIRSFTLTETTILYFSIVLVTGKTFSNVKIYPLCMKNASAITTSDYIPYIAPITKIIPQEIQALTGYGWGINDTCFNYIDFENKKFIQKVGRVDLGTPNYILSTSGGRTLFKTTISDIVGQINTSYDIPAICSIYNAVSTNKTWVDKDMAYSATQLGSKDITFVNNDYNTAADFKTAMSGVYLYYELATPIETDISSYLPADFNKIETNNNYTNIEFISEYGYDIPNKVLYYGTIKETLCTAINKNDTLAVSLTNNEAKYGWSAGSVANVRDYTTNNGSQKVAKVDLGTLNWSFNSDQPNCFRATLNDIKLGDGLTPNCLTVKYKTDTQPNTRVNDLSISVFNNTQIVFIHDNSFNENVPAFKAAMSGVYLYYELAEAIPEDITPLENNVIEVVENDELGFVNSENQAVPSEITYRIEVEK